MVDLPHHPTADPVNVLELFSKRADSSSLPLFGAALRRSDVNLPCGFVELIDVDRFLNRKMFPTNIHVVRGEHY